VAGDGDGLLPDVVVRKVTTTELRRCHSCLLAGYDDTAARVNNSVEQPAERAQ
jgi:hypothetical protein